MAKMTFAEIRAKYPQSYLLLIDYDEVDLPTGEVEITGAADVEAFSTGEEMLTAYQALKRSGRDLMFCTPQYQDRFIIERRPSMRVFG